MKQNQSSVRAWWIAIPGGLCILMIAMLFAITGSGRAFDIAIRNCGYTMIFALAFAVPFSRGCVDLSITGVAAFCTAIMGPLSDTGAPAAVMCVIAVLVGALAGLLNGCFAMLFRRKNALLMAAATFGAGLFYMNIGNLISGGKIINIHHIMSSGSALLILLPIAALLITAVLLSFTGGGKKAFSAIYLRNEEKNHNPIVTFLISGILAALAGVLLSMRVGAIVTTSYSFNPAILLTIACAGVALPNAKESKAAAFLGYLALIPAALGAQALATNMQYIGASTFACNLVQTIFAIVFIALNAIIGTRAAKGIGAAPAAMQPVPEAPRARRSHSDVQLAALSDLAQMYERGIVDSETFIRIKRAILSNT